MKIKVKVNSSAKKNKVEKTKDNFYKISTIEPAKKNKANFAIIDLVAEYFDTKKNNVFIDKGEKSKIKTIEVFKKN